MRRKGLPFNRTHCSNGHAAPGGLAVDDAYELSYLPIWAHRRVVEAVIDIPVAVYSAGIRRYGCRDQNQTDVYDLHIDVLPLGG